jgi:prolyl-tRNA editing enzyme YbaK/EbsC (Cys-tRNA(Pro) deacylase)
MSLPPSAQKVEAALARHGLPSEIVTTPQTARTAEDAASSLGVVVGRIVKSLVFTCDGEPVLALVSGPNRLDPAKLERLAGGTVERADAALVREATGFAIGGVPPLGHAQELRTFCDGDLLQYETVWAAAGTPHTVFEVRPDALVRAAGATVADLKQA